jgi:hypothetical protein
MEKKMVTNQLRAMDRMFERMMGMTGHRSPLAMVESAMDRMESALSSIPTNGEPAMDRMESALSSIPTNGEQFTVWKLTPTKYRTELQEDGSILFKVVSDGEFSDELKGPDVKKDK